MSQTFISLIIICFHFASSEWLPQYYNAEPNQMPPGYLAELPATPFQDLKVYPENEPDVGYDNWPKAYPLFKENSDFVPSEYENIKDDSEIVKKRSIDINRNVKLEVGKNHSADNIGLARNKRQLFIKNKLLAGFSSWKGKRTAENVREFKPKRIRFSSWGGKRSDQSMLKPWFRINAASLANPNLDNSDLDDYLLHDRSDKRTNHKFHSWGGKRINFDLPIFDAYSVQPLMANRGWIGRNRLTYSSPGPVPDNWKENEIKKKLQFSAWGGKRTKNIHSEVILPSDIEQTANLETNDDLNGDV